MCNQGLAIFPEALGILTFANVVFTYIIAVVRGDVDAFFPYISDTATLSPESCLFGQLLNISALLAFITICIRYLQIQAYKRDGDRTLHILSMIALTVGAILSLGLSIVANFQELIIEPVHLTGAMLAFTGGVIYGLIDTTISYKMHPMRNGLYICRVRLALSLLAFAFLVTTFVSGVFSRNAWTISSSDPKKLHWKPSDPGYLPHVISTGSEWCLCIAFLLYFFTYIRDFQKFKIEVKGRTLTDHLDQPIFEEIIDTKTTSSSMLQQSLPGDTPQGSSSTDTAISKGAPQETTPLLA